MGDEFRDEHGIDERLLPDFSAALLEVSQDLGAEKASEEPLLAGALVRDALRGGASDLHLDPRRAGVALRLRIDGRLREAALLPEHLGERIAAQFRTLTELDPVGVFLPEESRRTLDVDDTELDLRLVSAPALGGHKLSVRLLDPRRLTPSLPDLGVPEDVCRRLEDWLRTRTGMLLSTGPTGSGKTTTLYALLQGLRDAHHSVITLEDPIEYRIDGVTQIQVDESHGLTFAAGLRTVLRMDPDTILLGEIRDPDSATTAVRAAATGHSLMSTLHTRDAVGTVTALRSRGLSDHEIATSLTGAIGQRLVRTLCPDCRREDAPGPRETRWLEERGCEPPASSWHAVGCDACQDLGYRGRTGLFELWCPDAEAADAILEGADEHELRRLAAQAGLRTILQDALDKAAQGRTSLDELRFVHGLGSPRHTGA